MENGFDFGLFGLDMLATDLVKGMAEKDVSIACCPATPGESIRSRPGSIKVFSSLEQLVGALKRPRVMMLRAPADDSLLSTFHAALALLAVDDVIIDASDSWFHDSSVRARAAGAAGVHFLTLGLAANENDSRPLLMPGGSLQACGRVRRFLEMGNPLSSAAGETRCLGVGPSGHFIKMTHAAVETAFAEIIREVHVLLERGLGAEAGDLLRAKTDDPLFECLHLPTPPSAEAAARELGRWAVRAGRELEIPTLTLEAASGARSWENREALAQPFCQPHGVRRDDAQSLVAQAHGALSVATIIAYTEGLALLATASDRLRFHIDLPATLRVWRGGLARRGRLLEEIQAAFDLTQGLPNLLFDDDFSEKVMERQELLRHALWRADEWNIPTPVLAASLRYIDTFRDAWLPINLVQPGDFHWAPRPQRALASASLSEEWEEEDPPVTGRWFG